MASSATDARTVGIAADNGGIVYTAQWESHHSDQDRTGLYVSSYNGAGFTNLGGAVTDDYDYNHLCKPSLAVSGGDVYIAYTCANNSDDTKQVYVRRYNAGSWDLVGSGPVSAFSPTDPYDSANPDLIVANGVLYVAWQESSQFDGPFIYVVYAIRGILPYMRKKNQERMLLVARADVPAASQEKFASIPSPAQLSEIPHHH